MHGKKPCILGSAPQSGALQEDLQSQILRTAALEKADRGVQINVMPHRKSTGRARLEPCTLELIHTPSLDTLDLRLIDQVDVSRRHAVLSRRLPSCSVRRAKRISP